MKNSLVFLGLFLLIACNRQTLPEASTDPSVPDTAGDNTVACIDSSKIDLDAVCTMIYDPVCGCDGKTYGNACVAENSGVLRWEKGDCTTCIDENKINPNRPCTKIYKPVCGCDGKTYANACLAENAGVLKWTEGECQ